MIWNFLLNIFIAFILNVIAYVILPKPKRQRPEITDQRRDLETPTADTGRPIPVAFGTVNILAPNVLHVTDKYAVQISEYRENPNLVAYYATIHYGLCQGPVDRLWRVRVREKTAYGNTGITVLGELVRYNAPFVRNIHQQYFSGGVDREGGLVGRMLFDPGSFEDHAIHELLREKYEGLEDQLPAYRGICNVLFTNRRDPWSPLVWTRHGSGPEGDPVHPPDGGFYWGVNSPFIHPADFMVTRIPRGWHEELAEIPSRIEDIIEEEINELRDDEDSDDDDKEAARPRTVRYRVGPDCNPAHIIRECQTDTVWGGQVAPQLLDDTAYHEAAQTFFDEQLGLSELWVRQATIGDFIDNVLAQCETVMYLSPRTGKFVLRPIRSGYDVSTLIHFQDTNSRVLSSARSIAGEIPNEVVVNWTNPLTEQEDSVTLHNLAGIVQAKGEIISDTRTYAGIRYAETAWLAAERELAAIARGLTAVELETDRRAWDVSPGSVVRLTAPEHQFDDEIMRVLHVDYGRPGDSAVKLKLIEDVFAQALPDWEAPAQGAVPGIPRNWHVTALDSAASLEWHPPLSEGSGPILRYEYLLDGTVWREVPGGGEVRELIVRGLGNGEEHSFRLRAVNKAGPGLPTLPASVIITGERITVPTVPQDFRLRFVNSEAEVSCQPPLFDGGATVINYELDVKEIRGELISSVKSWEALPEEFNRDLVHRVVGLVIGRSYSFQLRAVNSVGPGEETHIISMEFRPDAVGLALPPEPRGFSARCSVSAAGLWWDNPYIYYGNHGTTLIYRGTSADFDAAQEIAEDPGIAYYDDGLEPETDYWYWIIWQSTTEQKSDPLGPMMCRTLESPSQVVSEFSKSVFDDPLTALLLAPIDRPESPISAAALFANLQTRLALNLLEKTAITFDDLIEGLSLEVDEKITDQGTATTGKLDTIETRLGVIDGVLTAEQRKIVALAARIMTIEGDYATATALESLRTTVTSVDGRLKSEAKKVISLAARIMTIEGDYATATALESLRTTVTAVDGRLLAEALKITALQSQIGDVSATAFSQLLTRVVMTEGRISSTAQELTALEASIGGRTLGPEQNTFEATTRALAEAARDSYARTHSAWLAQYDADDDINIELIWGVTYVYQRRLNSRWIDNGEVLARAAAVSNLNTQVIQEGNRITAVAEDVTSLETRMLGALGRAEEALRTRIESVDGMLTVTSEKVTNLLAQIGDVSAQAFMDLVAEVDDQENAIARWRVKTTVKDLTGGIGLYNDGGTVRLYVVADKFAVLPTGVALGETPPDEEVVPFGVDADGRVIINQAIIDRAEIEWANIVDVEIDNADIKDTARINQAKIEKGDIFNLTVGNVIQSINYSNTRGWRIERGGNAFFQAAAIRGKLTAAQIDANGLKVDWADIENAEIDNADIKGTANIDMAKIRKGDIFGLTVGNIIQSSNYSSTAGWRLDRAGNAFFQAAAIRGKITAAQISADVFNVRRIFSGSTAFVSSGTTIGMQDSIDNYDSLIIGGIGDVSSRGQNGFWTATVRVSALVSNGRTPTQGLTGKDAYWTARVGRAPGNSRALRLGYTFSEWSAGGRLAIVWGVNDPSGSGSPTDPIDPVGTAPATPTNLVSEAEMTTVGWGAVTGATSYEVKYHSSKSSLEAQSNADFTNILTNSYVNAVLIEDTWWAVRARNVHGVSAWSVSAQVKPREAELPDAKAPTLTLSSSPSTIAPGGTHTFGTSVAGGVYDPPLSYAWSALLGTIVPNAAGSGATYTAPSTNGIDDTIDIVVGAFGRGTNVKDNTRDFARVSRTITVIATALPAPTGVSASSSSLSADRTTEEYYVQFQFDDNTAFSSPSNVYDTTLSGIHLASWEPPASGAVYVRARFTTGSGGTGTRGPWSSVYTYRSGGTGADPDPAEAPTVRIAAVSSIPDNASISMSATVSGGMYDTLSYAWSIVSGGGTIAGSGSTATYTPPDVSSNRGVTVRCTVTAEGTGTNAEDDSTDSSSDTEFFTVTDAGGSGGGDPPVIGIITVLDLELSGAELIRADAVVTDPDGDSLTVTVAKTSGPALYSYGGTEITSSVRLSPLGGTNYGYNFYAPGGFNAMSDLTHGTYEFTFSATDGTNTVTKTGSITIS